MKIYIIGGLIIVVALIIATKLIPDTTASSAVTTGTTESSLTLENSSHDFGTIDIFGGKVQAEYLLKNTGTEDVQVLRAETSCMCTTGEIDGLLFGMHGSNNKQITVPRRRNKDTDRNLRPTRTWTKWNREDLTGTHYYHKLKRDA